MKKYLNGEGKLIGREVGNGILVDGKGHNIARYNEASDRTLDGKGKNIGVGDQRIKQLPRK